MTIKRKTAQSINCVQEKTYISRDYYLNQFDDEIKSAMANPEDLSIISFYGIGGIGKSTLLNQIIQRIEEMHKDLVYARYDFDQGTSKVSTVNALVNLLELKGMVFPRIATAREVLKANTGLGDYRPDKKTIFDNTIVNAATTVVGTFFTPVKAIKQGAEIILKDQDNYLIHLNRDLSSELKQIAQRSPVQLVEKYEEYFCEDLTYTIKKTGKRIVLLFDTYEKLFNTFKENGIADADDAWLEKVFENTTGITWCIAGREKLGWKSLEDEECQFCLQIPAKRRSHSEIGGVIISR